MASTGTTPAWVFIIIGIGGSLLLLVIVWIICKCRQRYQIDYSALDEERSLLQKWEDEKRVQKNAERDAILLNCYYYLRNSSNYSIVSHLPEIGSRVNKHWFQVQDSHSRTQKLLTMTQLSQQCVLPCTNHTKRTLSELFELLSTHPYLFPVLSIDLMLEQKVVIMIQPYIESGSLKDLIYCSHPKSVWLDKYDLKGKHLSESKIKTYGRQILEALIYLQSKGLPQCTHVHSGNVFIVNGVCKVSGYETTLFGYKSRLQPLIKSITKNNEECFEVVSFGHLLYEMTTGTELKSPSPNEEELTKCRSEHVVEVLRSIFANEKETFPYLEEIACHPFFKYANVSELNQMKKNKTKFSSNIKSLLKLYRKENDNTQRRRRKSERKKSRGESLSEVKRERTKSRSKSKKSSVDVPEPVVVFSPTQAPPVPPPPVFGSPPPPPPPQNVSKASRPDVGFERPPASGGRGSLLAAIRKGKSLKKTKAVNDRSAPKIS